MTESEYIELLGDLWPTNENGTSPEAMRVAASAVAEHPESAKLWCMLGDLIQVAPLGVSSSSHHPRECYEKAIAIDSAMPEAWESLGYFLDVINDDYAGAERAFRRALELEPSPTTYAGLARVLAEQGREEEALSLLEPCTFSSDPEVQEMRNEIQEGLWRPTESE